MTHQLFQLPKQTQIDSSARITPGAKAYFYATGTTTPQDTYTTSARNIAHPNPVVADANGVFPAIYLDPTLQYKVTLTTAADALIYTIDPANDDIGAADLRDDLASTVAGDDGASLIGTRRNAAGSVGRTLIEVLETVVPAADFGFKISASAADNAAAATAAIAARSTYGGLITLPYGTFACNYFSVPARIQVRGQGMFATRLQNSQSGYFIRLGGDISASYDAANRKVGVGLSDLSIEMSHKDGHAIQLMECVGAVIERIYSEGTLTVGRSNRFLNVDGGNADSFFCVVRDCITLHNETSFILSSTGAGKTTQVTLVACTAVGDVSSFPNSIGLRVTDDQGSGTVVLGCNFEACGRGVKAENNCQSFSLVGSRWEGNTKDMEAEANAGAITVIGGLYDEVNGIIDTQNRISRINGVNGSDAPGGGVLHGSNVLRSKVSGQVPLTVTDDVGYTTDPLVDIKSSAGDRVMSVSAQGKFLRIANNAPAVVNAACTDLPTAVALLNQIRTQLILAGVCA